MPPPGLGSLVGDFFQGYVVLGGVFSLAFQWRGLVRIDSAARGGTLGFRLLIEPGVVALWPILLVRWIRAGAAR